MEKIYGKKKKEGENKAKMICVGISHASMMTRAKEPVIKAQGSLSQGTGGGG